jgi:hypothetical protein
MKPSLTQDFEEQDEATFKTDVAFNETFKIHMINLGYFAEAEFICVDKMQTKGEKP